MMLQGPQISNMPFKSHVILIIINISCQVSEKLPDQSFQSATGLMRYDLRPAKIHFRPLGARFYEGSLLFGLYIDDNNDFQH